MPELKSVPGIGEVKLYDTSDGVMRDVVAGRLDMAMLDPPWCIRASRSIRNGTCTRCR